MRGFSLIGHPASTTHFPEIAPGVQVDDVWHNPSTTTEEITNHGGLITLSWIYGDGTTVNADGAGLLAAESRSDGKRVEGQFMFRDANRLAMSSSPMRSSD